MKGYDKFPFEERKIYEETFVENNSALIEELTGASRVFDISQTPMDKRSGVDLFHIQNNNIKYVKTHEESS
ncbi:hypothetical protein OAM87_04050 [Flavobacteriaceae bacterium]|nr:hypothetical protein [Flavobacteriaceae bacterium]